MIWIDCSTSLCSVARQETAQAAKIVKAFNKANDLDLPYVIGPRRDGDLPAFWADAAKAKALLGWEATHTVEDMCRSAWTFAKNAGSQE
jgi:UDP-glucose 4-epimerase